MPPNSRCACPTSYLRCSDPHVILSPLDTVRTNTVTGVELLDFTNELQSDKKIIAGKGSIGVVYRCPCKGSGDVSVFRFGLVLLLPTTDNVILPKVAVKAVTPGADTTDVEREKLKRVS